MFSPSSKIGLAALGLAVCLTSMPHRAQAFWRGGIWIDVPPVVVGPPAYPYPPPYYYPPAYGYPPAYAPAPAQPASPPAYTPPPEAQQDQAQADQRPYGATCYAGIYTCAAPPATPVESSCSCPGLGAPSYGVVQ